MKDYKILLISFVLLIFLIGAVSASDVSSSDNAMAVNDDGDSLGFSPLPLNPDFPPGPGGDDDPTDVEVTTKEIYVNDTGDDDNSGSAESPYATISKAYSEVNASNDATIYIGEGTFFLEGITVHFYEDYGDGDIEEWDEEYNGLYINLDHKTFGGNLKFIGAGADKTFLDGQSAFNFASIASTAKVTIKDVTFINCRSYNGGTIDNEGNLTIENCIFKDSYATGIQGGAITSVGSGGGGIIIIGGPTDDGGTYLTVKNSQFISTSVNGYQQWGWSPQGGGAIYVNNIKELYLENNTFIDNRLAPQGGTGVAVYSTQTKTYLINNKFINLTGPNDGAIFLNPADSNDGSKQSVITGNQFINCSSSSDFYSIAVLESGYHKFENNIFINSSNDVGNIFAGGYVETLNFEMDDAVINISNAEINNGVEIPFNVTDDMGNNVSTTNFNIVFSNENNTYYYYPDVYDGIAYISFSEVPENGIYDLIIVYNGDESETDVLTTVNISTSNDPIDLYVSETGSDANEGTQDSPFATIQHAMDVGFEKSFTVVVHLLKGRFYGEGNVGLTIANKGTLQILGEVYNETIIDGENSNWFMNVRTTAVTVENLKFINGQSSKTLITGDYKLTLKDCIVDSNKAQSYVMDGVLFDNLVYTNNDGSVYMSWIPNDSLLIANSYFANNNCSNYGVLVSYSSNYDVTVEHCKFINNSAAQPGAAMMGNIKSKNNYFEGNTAPNNAVVSVQGSYCSFENDTFINNVASSGNYGVLGTSYDITFTNCRFINNSAVRGGALGLTRGKIINSSFINNTADYGGAILSIPVVERSWEHVVATIDIEGVTFEGNNAKVNGNDIYFDENPTTYNTYKTDLMALTITFNDLNVSSLVDTLTIDVIGPCGAIVGGGSIDFVLNDTKIGSSEIVNSVASFNYAGFEDGIYTFSGNTAYANENSTFTNGTVTVKLEGILDEVEFWVSPEGSDEDGNGSEENPFKSISHAIAVAVKNCRNINIHIAEGVYTGDLNTALELSSMNNLTLIGAGADKTIIDGENSTYFAKVTDGNNKVSISDLTIKNMCPDNTKSLEIDSNYPITIIEGGNLYLNNVEVVDNHGGDAIIQNNGNLAIDNSVFRRNGYAQFGVINGGNVSIDNSLFEDNFAKSRILSGDNLIINNSEIKNAYLLSENQYSFSFALINPESNSQGNVTITNTNISNDGSVEDLNALGVNTEGKAVNPALDVNGNIYMNNCSMANNFNGTLNTNNAVASITYASAFGYSYTVDRNVNVYNTSIINYQYLWMATSNNVHNFILDGCVFENLEYIAYIRTNNPDSNYNITNSVFLNCTNVINQNHYAPMATPQHVNLNDNYWGNNDKPIVYFLDQGVIKSDVVEPDTWITLYSEDDITVIKNITDGENSTEYTGIAPIRTDYADNKGALDYAVVFGPVGYLFTTDEEENVILDAENPMYPFEAADPMDYRTNAFIVLRGFEGDNVVVCMLVDPVGNPIVNATITSTFEALIPVNTTTDENGIFKTQGGKNGILSIVYAGDDFYFDSEYNLTFKDAGVTADSFINIDAVKDGLVVEASLIDDEGAPIADALITLVLGNETFNTTTDANGSFSVKGVKDGVLYIVYDGDDTHLGTVYEFTFENAGKTTKSFININVIKDDLVVEATLVDDEGTPIANATVSYTIGNETFNTTTDANGVFEFNGVSNGTIFIEFAGTETADAVNSTLTFKDVATETVKVESHFDIENRAITITGYAVDTAAGEEGMYYATTLLDANGTPIANAYIEFAVNNKIYNRTTYENGSFDPYKLNMIRAGRYTMAFNFAGDENYTNAFACVCVDLDKKPITIKASAKSYKASVKTKKFTATLTTIAGSSHDGKVYLSSGKKVTLTVNGKTFTGTTDSNGKVTFKITNLKKKGKYTAKISFEGDKTYDSAEKSVKLTIK